MDSAADDPTALGRRLQGHGHQIAHRREDDGRIEPPGRLLVRASGPSRTQRTGEFLGRAVARAREGKDLPALPETDLGDDLGGMPMSGPTDYATRRSTAAFATGIEAVLGIAARCRPALLCSERDPLHCHRFLMISRHLHGLPEVRVSHIRHDGTLESHEEAEARLMALHGLTADMLTDHNERLAEAYTRQERKLG